MYEKYTALKIERRGRILVVTMHNPPLNPMTPQMHNELSRIFFDINNDPDTSVVVLTGAEKGFSAGGNLKGIVKRLEENNLGEVMVSVHEGSQILKGLLGLKKPIIARVNGAAIGLGSSLAAFCDISIAVETAKIADTHVKIGLAAGDGGSAMWPLLMGFGKARRYLFTGDMMTGKEAAEMGLISESCPAEELDERVYGLAEKLAALPPIALSNTKRAVNLLLMRLLDGVIDSQFALESECFFTADHKEAIFALNEKREPHFTGK